MEQPSSFRKLKDQVSAYRVMEDAIGKDRTSLTNTQKIERKNLIRKTLGIEKPQESNFNKPEFNNALVEFFTQLGMKNPFSEIKVIEMPKGMYLHIKPPTLFLEKRFVDSSDEKFVSICILHELYHNFAQNMLPDMKEVKYMTDYFGPQTIAEMDIDSDVETYLLMLKQGQTNFNDYIGLIYDVLSSPSDLRPREFKVARFIGSLVSIYFADKTSKKAILYPHINRINENKLFFACIADGR